MLNIFDPQFIMILGAAITALVFGLLMYNIKKILSDFEKYVDKLNDIVRKMEVSDATNNIRLNNLEDRVRRIEENHK